MARAVNDVADLLQHAGAFGRNLMAVVAFDRLYRGDRSRARQLRRVGLRHRQGVSRGEGRRDRRREQIGARESIPVHRAGGQVSRYTFWRFLGCDVAGEVMWVALYVGPGSAVGSQWELIGQFIGDFSGQGGGCWQFPLFRPDVLSAINQLADFRQTRMGGICTRTPTRLVLRPP